MSKTLFLAKGNNARCVRLQIVHVIWLPQSCPIAAATLLTLQANSATKAVKSATPVGTRAILDVGKSEGRRSTTCKNNRNTFKRNNKHGARQYGHQNKSRQLARVPTIDYKSQNGQRSTKGAKHAVFQIVPLFR